MATSGFFDMTTTYQDDYIRYKLEKNAPQLPVLYDPLENLPPPPRPRQMNLETLQPFKKDVYVPFDLLFRHKEAITTNPHKRIPLVKLEDKIFEEKLKVRKTRPRVYMLPQICLDDVPEDVMYGEEGLAAQIYTSEWKQYTDILQAAKACKNTSKTSKEAETDDILTIQNAMNSVRYKPSHPCLPMDAGMQKYARDWDRSQSRDIVDKNNIFWSRNKDKGLCSICEGLDARIHLSETEKEEIRKALEDDLVRSPYSLLPPGYGGYKPKVPVGIGVRRILFKKYEPFISTLMQVQGMYVKPSLNENQ